ncbi:MAG: TetR/AcrR family transcriptional regulator [Pseudomonadota bacterium]
MNSPRRRRDAGATRQRILQAAAKLLARNEGALEMSWVAKEAEVSQGLAYHHFGSREGLLEAVVNDFYDRLEGEVLMASFSEIESWEERELCRSERYIAFLIEDPLGPTLMNKLSQTPAVAALEANRWKKLVSEGARNIGDGQRRGVVRSEDDPLLLAAMVLGAMRSAVVNALQEGRIGRPEELNRNIWRFLRAGLQIDKENDDAADHRSQ